MLSNISNLGSVLSRTEQQQVQGGQSFMCAVICGPGDGNTPIYEDDGFPFGEEVGCVCGS